MTALPWIALALLAAAFVISQIHLRQTMDSLNKMLDEAIRGEFDAERYNETEVSKIESKMSQFLSVSKLKKSQIEDEQGKIRELISDISHQTKTPIANVLLYAQLLCERSELSEEARALATQIITGADKLNFLIQALIKASRLENGIIKVSTRKSDVGELIAAAVGECGPKAQEKGIVLTVAFMPETVCAMFDPKWCAEALYNILDNAVKYTDAGGRIDISATAYEMFARIDVRDTGMGIRQDDLPRVFGRFWRAKEASGSDGVGIGLYLAREIVTACGGYLKVSSSEGKGSVFSVFLPLV